MLKHEQFPGHEQFEEWCALAAAGQLSPGEQRKLSAHLEECESCRRANDEFAQVFRELPPEDIAADITEDRDLVRQLDANGFRERFLERATAEGHRFSPQARRGAVEKSRSGWLFPVIRPAYAWTASVVAVAILSSAITFRFVNRSRAQQPVTVSSKPAPPEASTPKPSEAPADPERETFVREIAGLHTANETFEKDIAALREDNGNLLDKLKALEQQLISNQSERQQLESAFAHSRDANTELAAQLEQAAQNLTKTKAELDSVRTDRAGENIAAQRAEIARLSDQLRLERASVDHDRELLVASRDVTDLMGARALHIIDVHDANSDGKDRKSFGRVFYTEGKSLIFYAFDLDEKRLANAKYTFEAWGERIGQPSSAKSLGVLYSDDRAQKRWALKVDDPRQLAEIDSVFVTLEPSEGSREKPRGRRILYAFLAGSANHP